MLFCDLVDSTGLQQSSTRRSYRVIMERYFAAVRAPIERHGGTVEKFIGDAVMAVFGVPKLHEDDALRAARAADPICPGGAPSSHAEWDVRWPVASESSTGEVHVLLRAG